MKTMAAEQSSCSGKLAVAGVKSYETEEYSRREELSWLSLAAVVHLCTTGFV